MKTIRNIIAMALVTMMGLVGSTKVEAQISDYKYAQLFDQAFELVLEGNHRQALPILTRLYDSDGNHGQVQYLLGMCRINCGMVDAFTVHVLQKASKNYSALHQRGRVEDRTAPARVWLHLAEACSEIQEKTAAIEAYRNYMSCIPLATLDHKRMVVSRIRELKDADRIATVTENGTLAELRP